MMSQNSTIGRRRVRVRAARTARAAAAVAAALTIGGTTLPAGPASAATATASGVRPRAFLSVDGELNDVTVISVSNAWAVGSGALGVAAPILAHWDGRKWTEVMSPALPSTGQLDAVAKFPGGAWAVGNSGSSTQHLVILRLTGTTASRVATPNVGGGALFDVAASSATNAWAVGQSSKNRALALHWNGTRWTRTPLPAGSRAGNLGAVATTSMANAWAFGEGPQGDNFLLHWNGKRWNRSALPAVAKFAFLRTVTATSATNAWIVGGGLILHWNGKKWTQLPSPKPQSGTGDADLIGLAQSSARSAWAVGQVSQQDIPVIARWNETSWVSVAAPVAAGQLLGVAISPSGRAWAVGKSGTGQTLILHWDGKAWH
jgi:hypothetical protein